MLYWCGFESLVLQGIFLPESTFSADCLVVSIYHTHQHLCPCQKSQTLAAVLLSGHKKILYTLTALGSSAFVAAVPYLLKATHISHKGQWSTQQQHLNQDLKINRFFLNAIKALVKTLHWSEASKIKITWFGTYDLTEAEKQNLWTYIWKLWHRSHYNTHTKIYSLQTTPSKATTSWNILASLHPAFVMLSIWKLKFWTQWGVTAIFIYSRLTPDSKVPCEFFHPRD